MINAVASAKRVAFQLVSWVGWVEAGVAVHTAHIARERAARIPAMDITQRCFARIGAAVDGLGAAVIGIAHQDRVEDGLVVVLASMPVQAQTAPAPMQTVEVTGIRASLAKSLSVKKEATANVEVITAPPQPEV